MTTDLLSAIDPPLSLWGQESLATETLRALGRQRLDVIVIVSDTHGRDGHRLAGETLRAVREADLVVHAGDFMTASVLDAFEAESRAFVGVFGNNDESAIRQRLPATRTFEENGVRFALTHRRDGGETGLAMFGRERDADVVVFGHSHRPTFEMAGDLALLNPGSHADPRWYRPGHAELTPTREGFDGVIREPDGTVLERFQIEP